MTKGKLVVLSAPSGTGKTSVCKKLLERLDINITKEVKSVATF